MGDRSQRKIFSFVKNLIRMKQNFNTLLSILFLTLSLNAQDNIDMEQDSMLYILKNKASALPLNKLNRTVFRTSYGANPIAFGAMLNRFSAVPQVSKDSIYFLKNRKPDDVRIVTFMAPKNDATEKIELHQLFESLKRIPRENVILILFGIKNAYVPEHLLGIPLSNCSAIVYCSDTSSYAQGEAAQLIMGARKNSPPATIHSGIKYILGKIQIEQEQTETNGRLRYAKPSSVGIEADNLSGIDSIAKLAIKEGALPGCQVLVSVKGNIIYQKSFGTHTYEEDSKMVQNEDVYDIASITKIAGSTLLAMYLEHYNLLDVDDTLGKYIPELTDSSEYGQIVIREMMAHQAGLKSWIPFYTKTLKDGELNPEIFKSSEDSIFSIEVAENIFIHKDYPSYMYERILNTPLRQKKYKYSDLCYYFTQKVFESILKEGQNEFLHREIYGPMGLQNIRYNPLEYFEKDKIVPTEHDRIFRKQLIHGYVHDPGAAMLGGVGGHAGIFSNSADLAAIMQLFLRTGSYAGNQYFSEKIIKDFTKKQFENNRRGVGFDRPKDTGGGTCDKLASKTSYGHSGFTGALAWADPKDEVIFIFLSNRVHPKADNWKIRDMNIRTDMQHIVYQALMKR